MRRRARWGACKMLGVALACAAACAGALPLVCSMLELPGRPFDLTTLEGAVDTLASLAGERRVMGGASGDLTLQRRGGGGGGVKSHWVATSRHARLHCGVACSPLLGTGGWQTAEIMQALLPRIRLHTWRSDQSEPHLPNSVSENLKTVCALCYFIVTLFAFIL